MGDYKDVLKQVIYNDTMNWKGRQYSLIFSPIFMKKENVSFLLQRPLKCIYNPKLYDLIWCIHRVCSQITASTDMHSSLTYWMQRIDISRGFCRVLLQGILVPQWMCCWSWSWLQRKVWVCSYERCFHSRPTQRHENENTAACLWSFPRWDQRLNTPVQCGPFCRSPTEFLSPLLTLRWTPWITVHIFTAPLRHTF